VPPSGWQSPLPSGSQSSLRRATVRCCTVVPTSPAPHQAASSFWVVAEVGGGVRVRSEGVEGVCKYATKRKAAAETQEIRRTRMSCSTSRPHQNNPPPPPLPLPHNTTVLCLQKRRAPHAFPAQVKQRRNVDRSTWHMVAPLPPGVSGIRLRVWRRERTRSDSTHHHPTSLNGTQAARITRPSRKGQPQATYHCKDHQYQHSQHGEYRRREYVHLPF
jgi:hypothetical protein